MARMYTARDYIYARPETRNLYVRLRNEHGKRFGKSLGTSDQKEAEQRAVVLIAEHKARLASKLHPTNSDSHQRKWRLFEAFCEMTGLE